MSMLKKLIYTQAAYLLLHLPTFFLSVLVFKITGKTPWFGYWSMRKLFYFKGHHLRDLDKFLSKQKFLQTTEKSIFQCSPEEIENIVNKAEVAGYCILPFKLPEQHCDHLVALGRKLNCLPRVPNSVRSPIDQHDKTKAGMYDFSEADLRSDGVVKEIANDPIIKAIAAGYLKSEPINDLVAMWWSFPRIGEDLSKAAQLYHADLDRLRFIKFFFHLTDVTAESGPHRYLKGSHRNTPPQLRKDGRHSDAAVFRHFSHSDEIVFEVPRGTILIEDTSGLHKGTPLISGNRLMFQLEFSSSWYGQSYI